MGLANITKFQHRDFLTQMEIITTKNTKESVTATLLRFALYFIGMFACTFSLSTLLRNYDISIFLENGPIEWTQFFILFLTTLLFIIGSIRIPKFSHLFMLLASVSAFAGCRELDALLDETIPVIGWKIAFIFFIFAAWLVFAKNNDLKRQFRPFLASRSFSLLFAGFLIAVPFAQLIGNGTFLELLMNDSYHSDFKRTIEELGELFGYILLMIGAIESLMQMGLISKQDKKSNL